MQKPIKFQNEAFFIWLAALTPIQNSPKPTLDRWCVLTSCGANSVCIATTMEILAYVSVLPIPGDQINKQSYCFTRTWLEKTHKRANERLSHTNTRQWNADRGECERFDWKPLVFGVCGFGSFLIWHNWIICLALLLQHFQQNTLFWIQSFNVSMINWVLCLSLLRVLKNMKQ